MEFAPFEMDHGTDPRSRSSTWPLPDPNQPATDSPERVTIKTERQESESPLPLTPKSEPKKMRNAWGNLSYAELITQAILSSPDKRLTLSEIYDWIVQNVPYFADKANSPSTAGWKVTNSGHPIIILHGCRAIIYKRVCPASGLCSVCCSVFLYRCGRVDAAPP